MRINRSITLMVGCIVLFTVRHATAGDPCPTVTDSERTRLIAYVQAKYKVPPASDLKLSEVSLIEKTCYRRLRFAVEDSQRPFKIDLTASPDLRFLTRELLDSQLDPVQQERQKQQALTAALTRGDFAVLGEKAAPVTITVFADFQCPYCAEASDVLMKNILPAEGGNTRLVFRHFPLAMHPWARPAAEAAACAHEQGDRYFWSFHNYIFEHQREITPDNLRPKLDAYGTALQGFDPADFTACLDQKRTAAKVEQDVALGTEAGVRGTPTLFINGQLMSGVQPEQIRTYIREMTDRAKN